MPPIGPPPYTHEQISAMTSQAERTRAYAELTSYVARLKREKAERQKHEAQGYLGNRHSSSPHRKHGGPSHGSTHYHPYQRTQTTDKGKSATNPRNVNGAESVPKQPSSNAAPNRNGRQTNPNELCPAFTAAGITTKRYFRHLPFCSCASNPSVGVCSRPGCPYIHDPDKQAVCKHWFYKDACTMGKTCSLSHVATPHNTPTCTYFMAGRCNHDGCPFAHVRVDPTALNCEEFGSMGYCEKGDKCTKLHAHECPYFANTGTCHYGTDCRLGHCHRASRMKASRLSSPASNTPNRSNTPEGDTDATKTNLEQIVPKVGADQQLHQFTQQADFVSFDDDP